MSGGPWNRATIAVVDGEWVLSGVEAAIAECPAMLAGLLGVEYDELRYELTDAGRALLDGAK